MKRKLSRLELAILIVPLLALVLLAARGPLLNTWNRFFRQRLAVSGRWSRFQVFAGWPSAGC